MNPALPATPDLFDALSDLIPTGSILHTPVRDAGGAVVNFALSRRAWAVEGETAHCLFLRDYLKQLR